MNDAEKPDAPSNFDTAVGYLKEGGGYDVTVAALFLANGVPVPPSIVKRFRIGVGRLIDGSFDLLAGSLERKNARLDFGAKLQEAVVKEIAKSGANDLAEKSPNISGAVALSMLSDYGLKLENKAAVAQQAFQELAKEPISQDEAPDAEISADWLNYFSDIAAQKSDPEMQRLMGQILAGEIRKPGSFSPITVSVLSTLTTPVAQKFEQLCRLTVEMNGVSFVLTNIFPDFLIKGIPEIGLTYVDVLNLRTHQLLANERGSGWKLAPRVAHTISNCGRNFFLLATGNGVDQNIPMALFSQVGIEMRRLVSPDPLPWFDEKLATVFSRPDWLLNSISNGGTPSNSGN